MKKALALLLITDVHQILSSVSVIFIFCKTTKLDEMITKQLGTNLQVPVEDKCVGKPSGGWGWNALCDVKCMYLSGAELSL